MATGDLKGDLINGAYSKLVISGITTQPKSEEITLGIERLEDMMAEFEDRNICVNYAFEDEPGFNTLHNVDRKYWEAIKSMLAYRLVLDFGKEPTAALSRASNSAFSFLSSSTAITRETAYPNRMPRGSGSTLRYNRWQRFYRRSPEPPMSCETIKMYIGDINDFVEHFDSYLLDSEVLASYTLEADSGLLVTNDTLSSPDITYRVEAEGNNGTKSDNALEIIIVATTSLGRKETRKIIFSLEEA